MKRAKGGNQITLKFQSHFSFAVVFMPQVAIDSEMQWFLVWCCRQTRVGAQRNKPFKSFS